MPLYGFQLIPWTPLPEMKLDGVDEAEEPVDEEDREMLAVEEVWVCKEEDWEMLDVEEVWVCKEEDWEMLDVEEVWVCKEEDRERLDVEEVWVCKEEAGIDCPPEEDDALEEIVDEIELTVDFGVETELEAVEFTELVGCEED